ncbi:MAG: type III pantothenate kinase [Desulfobacterales bacterium]|nr:type III pantothenate kinase [Desulfobacterales bacterium]
MLLVINVNNTNTSFGVHAGSQWRAHLARRHRPGQADRRARDAAAQPVRVPRPAVVRAGGGRHLERRAADHRRFRRPEPPLPEARPADRQPTRSRPASRSCIDYPAEIGADRILNALGARTLARRARASSSTSAPPPPSMPSRAEGDYLGGAIAPGLGIAAEALFSRTAKLPRIELTAPPAAIGRNTVHAMQSGLVLGYVGLIEGLVARIRTELGGRAKVVATGGMAHILAEQTAGRSRRSTRC